MPAGNSESPTQGHSPQMPKSGPFSNAAASNGAVSPTAATKSDPPGEMFVKKDKPPPPPPKVASFLELEREEEEFGLAEEDVPLVANRRAYAVSLSALRDAKVSLSRMKEHKVAVIVGLAILAGLLLIIQVDFEKPLSHLDEAASTTTRKKQITPHSKSSFGGINNVAHPGGAKAAANGEGIAFQQDIVIPTSNVGHAVGSLSRANIINLWGHYVHDEHRSPYASHLYDKPATFLEEQQSKFLAKMEAVRKEWGAWAMQDPAGDDFERTVADFHLFDYRDVPREEFPPDAWQSDEKYLDAFIKEGRALVNRVQEGIYAEYGWPLKQKDGTNLTAEGIDLRDKVWRIHTYRTPEEAAAQTKGIARLSEAAFYGLSRKLLHGMMTHDEFYAVLGGHSAAAGHGNDFQQNRIMMFHRIMEPVFDKLGMRLVSRNMAMGGVGTLQFSLGGGDLYGEADILEWDSGMTEKGAPVDFFNKQAILSGERVPIIMTDFPFNIMQETNNTAWMGQYIGDNSMIPVTTLENAATIPYAARWLDGREEKYNAICWEPRTDVTPPINQAAKPGSQVSWHPGNRNHQWQGRKLALVILKALSAAFDAWEKGLADGVPLAESYWHVGERYKEIRQNLRTHINTPISDKPEEDVRSDCERMFTKFPRVCRVQMHGYGMWNPRVNAEFDLLNIIKPAPNGFIPHFKPERKNLYDGFDLLPLIQAVPDGEVDVHAIAIASRAPAPDLDHSWTEDNNKTAAGKWGAPPTRRWLRKATELALQSASSMESTTGHQPVSALDAGEGGKSLQSSNSQQPSLFTLKSEHRRLNASSTGIIPGRGWDLHQNAVEGFCDGSAQSECNRPPENECLLYGTNDRHLDVHGNALSGWLVFDLPKVKEGIVMARMEWWCGNEKANVLTADWTEVNNGKTEDTTPWNQTTRRAEAKPMWEEHSSHERMLKPTPDDLVPKDFEMDYAINGEIKTVKRDEWLESLFEYSKNCAPFLLLNDESMAQRDWDGEPMEVAIRFRTAMKPKQTYCVSHLYYA